MGSWTRPTGPTLTVSHARSVLFASPTLRTRPSFRAVTSACAAIAPERSSIKARNAPCAASTSPVYFKSTSLFQRPDRLWSRLWRDRAVPCHHQRVMSRYSDIKIRCQSTLTYSVYTPRYDETIRSTNNHPLCGGFVAQKVHRTGPTLSAVPISVRCKTSLLCTGSLHQGVSVLQLSIASPIV